MSEKKFDQWAIVEVMGHQRLAGRVTEQAIGGTAFVRVDVPAANDKLGFTKLLGSGAIYAITIVDEETARAVAAQLEVQPIDEWSARTLLGLPPRKQGALELESADRRGDDDGDDDDPGF